MVINEGVNNKQERRINIDIAKGIGIILVVWAHANGPFSNYIEQFHMPFFFFISGMLYRNEGRTIREYGLKKCKGLLVPFWWWNLLFYPLFYILYYWGNWSISESFKGLLAIIFTVDKVPFLGATWFLPSLFWVSVSVHIFFVLFRKCKWCDGILVICGVIICTVGIQITFPFRISRTLICLLYYILGYIYNKYIRKHMGIVFVTILSIICLAAYILIASINSVSLGSNYYKYKLAFIIGAYLAIYFTLWVSNIFAHFFRETKIIRHIIYLGENSIDLVIWQFLAFRIAIVIQIIIMKISISSITAFPVYDASGLWWSVYILTGIYGSLLWKSILNHNPGTPFMKKMHMIR